MYIRNTSTGERRLVEGLPSVPKELPDLKPTLITRAFWENKTSEAITSFQATWSVPSPPRTYNGQKIFFSHAVISTTPPITQIACGLLYGTADILRYGPDPAWWVGCWVVRNPGGEAFRSEFVRVHPGDTLDAEISLSHRAASLFNYEARFVGIRGAFAPLSGRNEFSFCSEELNAGLISACSDYPKGERTTFRSINVLTGDHNPHVNWHPDDRVTDCGQHTDVVRDSGIGGEIDLWYSQCASLRRKSRLLKDLIDSTEILRDSAATSSERSHYERELRDLRMELSRLKSRADDLDCPI